VTADIFALGLASAFFLIAAVLALACK